MLNWLDIFKHKLESIQAPNRKNVPILGNKGLNCETFNALSADKQMKAVIDVMVAEAMKTSEIEV